MVDEETNEAFNQMLYEEEIKHGNTNMDYDTWKQSLELYNQEASCPHCKQKFALSVDKWNIRTIGKKVTWYVKCKYCGKHSKLILEIFEIKKQ